MTSRITFHGGAGSVTGVNIKVDTGAHSFLVDCGIEQREDACHEVNHGPFPYDPSAVGTLFVTHAHQDHIGRIPKLVRDGFSGTIRSTPATKDLAALMFRDAFAIMSGPDARCEPLYDGSDIDRTLSLWETHEYHAPFQIEGMTCTFLDAGHILGSAMLRAERGGRVLLFSGDLGNSPEPLLRDTESAAGANYIVMESVYGDRVHEGRAERRQRLKEVVEATRARGGVLLIPSFSIERTQVLLFELNAMVESGEMQPIPVFLDAPLGIQVTEVYRSYKKDMNADVEARYAKGDDPFEFKGLTLTPRQADSIEIHRSSNPKVIIAGAGMSHGGRIREHEKHYLGDKNATILFVGYQSPGSLGRRIFDGQQKVEIDGESVRVLASVEGLFGYSGHRDRDGLLQFLKSAGDSVEKAFIVMGEPRSSLFFAQRAHDFLGVDALAPEGGTSFELEW